MSGQATHWEQVYKTKAFDAVSWYAPHLSDSLALIQQLCANSSASVMDVGGGESSLVDDLLAQHFSDVTVLDLSATALAVSQQRLGAQAAQVKWLHGDVTNFDFGSQQVDIWHDRAVFHFLTTADARQAYVEAVLRVVKPGGHVVMATFGHDGPQQCSGLDVVQYDETELHGQFGAEFELLGSHEVVHTTPTGAAQQFIYCWCKLVA